MDRMSVSLLVQSEHRQYITTQIHYKGNVLKTPTSFPVCKLCGRRLSECGLAERGLSERRLSERGLCERALSERGL